MFKFTISNKKKFLFFRSATDLIQIQNFLFAQNGPVTDYRGLKYNWRTKLVIETVSLNQLFSADVLSVRKENGQTLVKISAQTNFGLSPIADRTLL